MHLFRYSLCNNLLSKCSMKYLNNSRECFVGKIKSQNSNYTTKELSKKENAFETEEFKEVYRFPPIRIGYCLHKLKWYQTLAAGVVSPVIALLGLAGIVHPDTVIGTVPPFFYVTVNLYFAASAFDRAIGFIYLSKDETTVRVSYLDFWGRRVDDDHPVEEVVPYLEAPRNRFTDRICKQVVFYTSDKKLKMYRHLCQVTDEKGLFTIFGKDNL